MSLGVLDRALLCPNCAGINVHLVAVLVRTSNDEYWASNQVQITKSGKTELSIDRKVFAENEYPTGNRCRELDAALVLNCEHCGEQSTVSFEFHKGSIATLFRGTHWLHNTPIEPMFDRRATSENKTNTRHPRNADTAL